MKLPKTLSSKAIIRFQDCDPFNHLNNAKYLNYFMNHREDQLINKYDLDIYKVASKLGKSWVVTSSQIAYLRPATLMEEVEIESQLIAYSKSQLKVEMRMYNSDKTQLKSIVWCSFTHYNLLKQRKEIHHEKFMTLFESVVNPLKELNFDERLCTIKNQFIKKL